MGGSSKLCSALKPGEPVIVMGPTGTPSEIPENETVLLVGGGLGNAVLLSIGKALKEKGNRVLYFAGYRKASDLFKQDEIEASTDQLIWAVDSGEPIKARRPDDLSFVGNIVQAMDAYSSGKLQKTPKFAFSKIDRILAIGSDRMMAAVHASRSGVLKKHLNPKHVGIGSINSSMQCMMKEVCAQCLQRHVDPVTGKESFVFSCFNQDQDMNFVDWKNLNERLKMNSLQEKLANLYLTFLRNNG
jgi:NAD(P)H-flavin reductase